MMYINSRFWIFLFLFYGMVCFLMGFFGYWLKTDKPKSPASVQVPVDQELNGEQRNLMVESEEYLTKFLTKFNVNLSDVSKTEPSIINSRKLNETLQVSAASSTPASLVFCFPENYHTGALQPIIARSRFGLKTGFTGVKEIPMMEAGHWETKLGQIINWEQPPVLIGLNITRNEFSDCGGAGVNIDLYLAMRDQWQGIILPQVIVEFSCNLNTFNLEKLNLDGKEVFKITWTEATEHLTGLERNMKYLIKTLEQIPELRTAKKI